MILDMLSTEEVDEIVENYLKDYYGVKREEAKISV